jgi:phospholipid transport system substrate-binding protein
MAWPPVYDPAYSPRVLSPYRRGALTVVLAAALGLLACPSARAGPPTDRLREFFAKVHAVLADPTTEQRALERVARIRRLVGDIADMTAASAAALGPEWETKSPAERDEFITLFADVLERAYVGRLAGAVRGAGGLEMTYSGETLADSEATVTTALRGRGGHDLRVEYRMTLWGGRCRVRDIVLDGVSTVENYRAQFRRLREQGSYLALVTKMRDKLTEDAIMFTRLEPRAPTVVATAPVESEVAPALSPDVARAVSMPSPSVREPVQRMERVTTAVPRAEPVARRSAPVLASMSSPAVAVLSPARLASATPVVAASGPVNGPGVIEAALGACRWGSSVRAARRCFVVGPVLSGSAQSP